MDLETENRIAAILLKEAAELRRQAQSEGALAYLRQPTVRSRPNSRFLTATVRGVQQANRAVEVNEMWRIRDKQLELENRLHSRNKSSHRFSHNDISEHHRSKSSGSNDVETSKKPSFSSKERHIQDLDSVDEGLRDDEVDEFLQSRTKRGRGAVGSRMDEAGPYPYCPDFEMNMSEASDVDLKKARVVLGPEKPYSFRCSRSSDDEPNQNKKKSKKSSNRLHSRQSKSKEKSRDKKRHKSENRSKHHK